MARPETLREQFSLKKELRLTPGYILCIAWVVFTIMIVGWTICASLVSPADIFSGDMMKAFFERLANFELRFDNYAKAWTSARLSTYFLNSMIYSAISLTVIIVIAAPAS
jgi:N-acetylglucosamine transport system permease protein